MGQLLFCACLEKLSSAIRLLYEWTSSLERKKSIPSKYSHAIIVFSPFSVESYTDLLIVSKYYGKCGGFTQNEQDRAILALNIGFI